MTVQSILDKLTEISNQHTSQISAPRPQCVCNADSWREVGIETTSSGSTFFVCPVCDPKRECALCNKTGHKLFFETLKQKQSDGKEFEITIQNIEPNACGCMDVHKIAELLNAAEIPDRYIKAKFSSFKFTHFTPQQAKILEQNIAQINEFCKNTQQKYFATLFGNVGSGKTLLATAALKFMIIKYKLKGKFIDFQYLLSLIRNQFDQNRTGENLINMYRTTDILVIDEFAKARIDKEWPLEKLDDLINYRYNHKKITILTTNYLPFQMKYNQEQKTGVYLKNPHESETLIHESFWDKPLVERIGERMYDRLIEVSEFINFTALPSYRKFMAKDLLARMSTTSDTH